MLPKRAAWAVGELPDDVLPFLLASRYCDTEKLSNLACPVRGHPARWHAHTISDYVDDRITFGYEYARATGPSEGHERVVAFVAITPISP